jgi:hypothetical protein
MQDVLESLFSIDKCNPNFVANWTFSLIPLMAFKQQIVGENSISLAKLQVIAITRKIENPMHQSHLSNENFVGERAINVRSIKKSDTSGDGMADERYHFLIGFWRAIPNDMPMQPNPSADTSNPCDPKRNLPTDGNSAIALLSSRHSINQSGNIVLFLLVRP